MVRRPSRRAFIGQWVLLVGVVAFGWLLADMVAGNYARKNLHFGFGFLVDPAHFDLPLFGVEPRGRSGYSYFSAAPGVPKSVRRHRHSTTK